jgi:hypothetical protein
MSIYFRRMFVFLSLISAAGCSGNAEHSGKLKIEGTATWNGAPIADGTVTLLAPDSQFDSAPIENGKFTIFTTPGPKTVSVMAERELGTPQPTPHEPNPSPIKFQYLPKEYNVESTLQKTVTSDTKLLELELTGAERTAPKY